VLVTLPIALYGNLGDYLGLKLAYLGDYPGVESASVALRRTSEALLPYWPYVALLVALGAAALRGASASRPAWCAPASPRDERIVAWIALASFALFAALASRRFYQHFFLFMVPPLVLLAVSFARLAAITESWRRFLLVWMLLFGLAAPMSAQETFLSGIRAYVFDGQPVLYFLTRTTPPTRFAFPESHLRDDVAARFGTTPRESVRRILQRNPRFVVAQPGPSGLGI
jgi:hypothetical protein